MFLQKYTLQRRTSVLKSINIAKLIHFTMYHSYKKVSVKHRISIATVIAKFLFPTVIINYITYLLLV